MPGPEYVFGYASLVALHEPLEVDGVEHPPVAGRLRGHRRHWGAAMDNWDPVNDRKHFLDPESGERPRIRVAYLDVERVEEAAAAGAPGAQSVNGLALPVDAIRLATLDEREVNYERVEVTAAFEAEAGAGAPGRVWAYLGTEAARERCRAGVAAGDVFVSHEYVAAVHGGFAALGPDALAEFERTTGPPPFPERRLDRVG